MLNYWIYLNFTFYVVNEDLSQTLIILLPLIDYFNVIYVLLEESSDNDGPTRKYSIVKG